MNKSLTKTNNKSNNNNNKTRNNWQMSIIHNINHECFFYKQAEMCLSDTCIGLKYPCDYGTDNYNPLCPGINSETSYANEGLFSYPAQ